VKSIFSAALISLAVCVSSATAAGTTLVSCLNARGLAIGTYNGNSEPNGDLAPTTLPANYNFAKAGTGEYWVVKGKKLPPASPNPKKGTPVLYVLYGPISKHRQGPDGPGLVLLGHYSVAWQHEPQSEANEVVACVRQDT
jgi:hypothetical protein